MKIAICNGSPKGEKSFTLQYIKYIMNLHKEIEFSMFHISKDIKKLENDPDYFTSAMESLQNADAVIWSFGLWVLSAPAQNMRFFELIKERDCCDMLKNKYTGILTTSIHFFDHTAHEYARAVCEDMGMMVADTISFHMGDLEKKEQRQNLKHFAHTIIQAVKKEYSLPKRYLPFRYSSFEYDPAVPQKTIPTKGKKILILTDQNDPGTNLGKMIKQFQRNFTEDIECVDLNTIGMKGACIGCMKCGYDYTCGYKDGFMDFYNNKVRNADIIVHAGELKSRYLSSLWKTFFDRAFFWNHTPSLAGKQFAYLISGPIGQNSSLIQIFEAHATARQHANYAGIVSDEAEDSAQIDGQIASFAERLITFADAAYVKPEDFIGTCGWKLFRDEIYAQHRLVWQADHRFFKKNRYYNFPNKKIIRKFVMDVISFFFIIPGIRTLFYANINQFESTRLGKIAEKAQCEAD